MHLARRLILVSCSTLLSLSACGVEVDPGGDEPASQTQLLIDDPAACTMDTIGDGTCVDAGTFKLHAVQACAEGLVLVDLQVDPGACTNGLVLSASYTCCPPSPAPPEPPPKEPGGGASLCEEHTLTGACQSVAALEAQAAQQCEGAGLAFVDRKFIGACPDGEATDAWFTCCGTP